MAKKVIFAFYHFVLNCFHLVNGFNGGLVCPGQQYNLWITVWNVEGVSLPQTGVLGHQKTHDSFKITFFKSFLHFLNIFILLFIYLFLAVLGLRCYMRAFSSCSERGLLFVAVHELLIAVASLVMEHGL